MKVRSKVIMMIMIATGTVAQPILSGYTFSSNAVGDSGEPQYSLITENTMKLTHLLYGSNAGEYFGFRASYLRDVNKDGYDDFIVGSHSGYAPPYTPYFAESKGKATVFSGQDFSVLFEKTGACMHNSTSFYDMKGCA